MAILVASVVSGHFFSKLGYIRIGSGVSRKINNCIYFVRVWFFNVCRDNVTEKFCLLLQKFAFIQLQF